MTLGDAVFWPAVIGVIGWAFYRLALLMWPADGPESPEDEA